ncbi:hypothetical protein [Pontixanthobacter sp. CEM42]|uniref:hypothetical protein n=1 Tax=Pontixanthobacter sp. CEM42 TaxID=2792077 RepID=UPI001ADF3928|nr:hypothetical protein [Pontixanthobacter sp. CEM42]
MLNTLRYLPLVAVVAFAVPTTAQSDEEIYEGAVNCSALHSYISGALEGEDDETAEEFFESGTRFFTLALVRNEQNAEKDLNMILDGLIEKVNGMEEDAEIEAFIASGITRCDTFRESVAEEYDAIDFEEDEE